MDYKKKYNEMVRRAKELYESGNALTRRQMEIVCPELTESEDERIRKEIKQFILDTIGEISLDDKENAWLVWLEKQKEQKPEFYPGDVVKCTLTGSLWVRCKEGDNIRSDGHTACIGGGFELASEEEAVQFLQELTKNGYHWDCIKGRPIKKEHKPAEWSDSFEENIRNLLHDKLTGHSKDGAMTWTTLIDDKTLKDIVNGIWFYVGKEALKYPNKELDVSEWSEENEDKLEQCIRIVSGWEGDYDIVKSPYSNFLKSLRPQPHWKPSKEQMKALEECGECKRCIKQLYEQLKKLM